MNKILQIIRFLQGERAGMSADRFLLHPANDDDFLIVAPTITISNLVRLPDVSFYQDKINFVQMKAAGAAGVVIRAGQRTWIDSKFHENWAAAKAAGLPRGSYWLYDSRATPESQAALWWSLLENDPPELVVAADFEENYRGAYGTKAHFKKFIQELQRLSGLPNDRIVCYTGYYYWLERVGNDPFFAAYGLWLAWYNVMSIVRIPLPWVESDLVFWQDTSHGDGTLYGVSSLNIDLNWYCCSYDNYVERFLNNNNGGGTTMPIYNLEANNNPTDIFSNPDGSGKIDKFPQGRRFKANLDAGTTYRTAEAGVGGKFGYVRKNQVKLISIDSGTPAASPSASPSPSPSASPSAGPTDETDIHITYTNGEPSEVIVDGVTWAPQ